MDPHKCSDFRSDKFDVGDGDAQNMALGSYMTTFWKRQPASVIARYNQREIAGQIYNGWAIWYKSNPDAPEPK